MRRTSVSLPTKNIPKDPYEKPARYGSNPGGVATAAAGVHRAGNGVLAGMLNQIQTGAMTQSQRSRYMKTGGILLFVLFLFYFLAPKGVNTVNVSGLSCPILGCPHGIES
jgi:guanosine-diphosphatase